MDSIHKQENMQDKIRNAAIYENVVNKSCERLGISPVIDQTRCCVITEKGIAK